MEQTVALPDHARSGKKIWAGWKLLCRGKKKNNVQIFYLQCPVFEKDYFLKITKSSHIKRYWNGIFLFLFHKKKPDQASWWSSLLLEIGWFEIGKLKKCKNFYVRLSTGLYLNSGGNMMLSSLLCILVPCPKPKFNSVQSLAFFRR